MSRLDRNLILGAQDTKTLAVEVPEWGGTVHVRILTGTERDALESEINANKGKVAANFRGRFASLVLCDESGARLFQDKDAVALGLKSAIALSRILDAGMAFNRVGDAEVKAAVGESEGVQS